MRAMTAVKINIQDKLLRLQPSDKLKSVSMSHLARNGTLVLRQMMTSAQPVAVKIQGHDAMVTLSQKQYDEMVALIHQLLEEPSEDGFTQVLGNRFDKLVAKMNQPNAAIDTAAALFSHPVELNQSYRPGATETED